MIYERIKKEYERLCIHIKQLKKELQTILRFLFVGSR